MAASLGDGGDDGGDALAVVVEAVVVVRKQRAAKGDVQDGNGRLVGAWRAGRQDASRHENQDAVEAGVWAVQQQQQRRRALE